MPDANTGEVKYRIKKAAKSIRRDALPNANAALVQAWRALGEDTDELIDIIRDGEIADEVRHEYVVSCWRECHSSTVAANIDFNIEGAEVLGDMGRITLRVKAPESKRMEIASLRFVVDIERNDPVDLLEQTDEQAKNPGIKEAVDLDES